MATPNDDVSSVGSEQSNGNFTLPSLRDFFKEKEERAWDALSEFENLEMEDDDIEPLEFRSRFSTAMNDDPRLKSYFSRRTTVDSNMKSKRQSMKSAFTRSDILTDSQLIHEFPKVEFDLSKLELDLLHAENERASNGDWTNLSPKESFEVVDLKKKKKKPQVVINPPKKKSENSRRIWFNMTKENQSVNTKTSPTTRKTAISLNKKRDSAKITSFAEETSPDTLEREKNVKIKSDGERDQTTISRKSKESFVSKFINIRLKKVSKKKSLPVLKKKPIWATVKLKKINGVKRSFLWHEKNDRDQLFEESI